MYVTTNHCKRKTILHGVVQISHVFSLVAIIIKEVNDRFPVLFSNYTECYKNNQNITIKLDSKTLQERSYTIIFTEAIFHKKFLIEKKKNHIVKPIFMMTEGGL